MSLYWKEIEIKPGMMLSVDLYHHEAYNDAGEPLLVQWKILSFGSRNSNEAYIDYATGKKYPLNKVIKKRSLRSKLDRAELLQLPACTEFMIVEEYYDWNFSSRRCYNLDMLQTVRNIRVVDEEKSIDE